MMYDYSNDNEFIDALIDHECDEMESIDAVFARIDEQNKQQEEAWKELQETKSEVFDNIKKRHLELEKALQQCNTEVEETKNSEAIDAINALLGNL